MDKFYNDFWKTQSFLSNPTLLFESKNYEEFKKNILVILDRFKQVQAALDGFDGRSSQNPKKHISKRSSSSHNSVFVKQDVFFPKFLTSRNLFELELKDPHFRRQIIAQILSILQFLSSLSESEKKSVMERITNAGKSATLNKAVNYSFVLPKEEVAWISERNSECIKLLDIISPGAKLFRKSVNTVLNHEKDWVSLFTKKYDDSLEFRTEFNTFTFSSFGSFALVLVMRHRKLAWKLLETKDAMRHPWRLIRAGLATTN